MEQAGKYMNKFYVVTNKTKDKHGLITKKVKHYIESKGKTCILAAYQESIPADIDVVITLGGDGTLIQAVRAVIPSDIPLVGVHLGTLGYLTEIEIPDIEQAIEAGLEVVKFFPAEQAGGVNMVKALSGPYRNVKFMPTGGITAKNIMDYFAISSVFACGGSWMVKDDLINAGDFDKIRELTQEAVALVK